MTDDEDPEWFHPPLFCVLRCSAAAALQWDTFHPLTGAEVMVLSCLFIRPYLCYLHVSAGICVGALSHLYKRFYLFILNSVCQ